MALYLPSHLFTGKTVRQKQRAIQSFAMRPRSSAPELAQRFYAEAGIKEAALRDLPGKCLPPLDASAVDAELLTALPRWRHNDAV